MPTEIWTPDYFNDGQGAKVFLKKMLRMDSVLLRLKLDLDT